MYRKDYILRLIELFAQALGVILGLIKKKDYNQSAIAIENAYSDFLQKEAAIFRVIPKENITETLLKEHNYTNEHLEILAQLFYAEAELSYAKENNEACLHYAEKALLLFEFIDNEQKTFSRERFNIMNHLKSTILLIS